MYGYIYKIIFPNGSFKNSNGEPFYIGQHKSDNFDEFEYNNARCFNVKVPNIGPAQAIYYDVASLSNVCKYVKKNNIKDFLDMIKEETLTINIYDKSDISDKVSINEYEVGFILEKVSSK